MNNLQWLPGLQYSFILISKQDNYNSEHQTHIWHYRLYFPQPVLANRDYNYIHHTKQQMLVTTPNITYNQYLELRDRFPFHAASFITIDLSELEELPQFYEERIKAYVRGNPIYDILIPESLNMISNFISRNPTYKINPISNINGWELNPRITPETIFDDVKYDKEGWVISVGKRKVKGDPRKFPYNPNFYCFAKHPYLLDSLFQPIRFAVNSANRSKEYLEYASTNRLIVIYIKDVMNITDFIIKPKQPDAIYKNIMNGILSDYFHKIINHLIYIDPRYKLSQETTLCEDNKVKIYLHTHLDPVKYDIDRL